MTSAIVLAGGKSSRMGRPKALLPFGDEPLIVHVVSTLGALVDDVVVVAAPDQDLPSMPVTLVRDEVAYQGPVGGIYYGLSAARGDVGFVTACDSAFLNACLIAHLVSRIPENDVVVPHWEGRLQPLHAVYRRTVLPHLEGQLARGELRPVHLFDKVRTLTIQEDEIRRLDPEGWSFFNMNTPDDYARALERWQSVSAPAFAHRAEIGAPPFALRASAGKPSAERRSAGAPSAEAPSAGAPSAEAPSAEAPSAERRAPTASVPCTVELFGVARLLARTRELSLELPAGATIADVFAALGATLPVLLGRVIADDGTRLIDGYACNVNGMEFIRTTAAAVNPGDNFAILSADAGG